MVEWFLFVPQSRLGLDDLVARAQAAEASGFDGVALLDHLETPMAPDSPIWEAMTAATWVAARTERLTIGHLVLCDAFRHPAVLAKQAVTLAEASGWPLRTRAGFGLDAPGTGEIQLRHSKRRRARHAPGTEPRASQRILGPW